MFSIALALATIVAGGVLHTANDPGQGDLKPGIDMPLNEAPADGLSQDFPTCETGILWPLCISLPTLPPLLPGRCANGREWPFCSTPEPPVD